MTRDETINMVMDDFDAEDQNEILGVVQNAYTLYSDKVKRHPRLVYLYMRKQGIRKLLTGKYKDVDYSEAGVSDSLGQMARQLALMLTETTEEIAELEKEVKGSRTAAIGQMTTTSPIGTDDTYPFDPNGREYRGDPLRITLRRP